MNKNFPPKASLAPGGFTDEPYEMLLNELALMLFQVSKSLKKRDCLRVM